jgi:hypothetical protein
MCNIKELILWNRHAIFGEHDNLETIRAYATIVLIVNLARKFIFIISVYEKLDKEW